MFSDKVAPFIAELPPVARTNRLISANVASAPPCTTPLRLLCDSLARKARPGGSRRTYIGAIDWE
ncbi:MAG: hypothetical protein MRY59_11190 [Aquisalinus sp.]|nr:hypothetical protein [Aquisalinus sp.]